MIHNRKREDEDNEIYRERSRFSLQLTAIDGIIAAAFVLGIVVIAHWRNVEIGIILLAFAALTFLCSGGVAGRLSRKDSKDDKPYVEVPRYNLDAQITTLIHFVEEQEQMLFDLKRQAFLGVVLGIVGIILMLGAELLLVKGVGLLMAAWYLETLLRWILNQDKPFIKKIVRTFSLPTIRGRMEKAQAQIEWYRQNRWKQ